LGTLKPNEILEQLKRDGFESVWSQSPSFLQKSTRDSKSKPKNPGSPHPVFSLIQKFRETFLAFGFDEIRNPIIIDEDEVYKQYGPEAAVILDRCFYLAALPRPDIGLSQSKIDDMEDLGISWTIEKKTALQAALRDYKKGEVDSDDFVEKLSEALEISDDKATVVISKVFPEFSRLKPISSSLTLRSHMTSAWFLTLQALVNRLELPIKLFSVDIRFRREQREDPTHIRAHYSASCVVMNERINVDEGENITRALLKPIGFKDFRFVKKKVTSKYYVPGTEFEGFLYNPNLKKWIEISNYGLYSIIALAKYKLEYPVLNVGIGVERVAMALHKQKDIRQITYPQFHSEWFLTDEALSKTIEIDLKPKSSEGMILQKTIESKANRYANEDSPCEFLIWEGSILGKKVKVYLYETDVGKKLLGPASFNEIYVLDGNILGVPREKNAFPSIVPEAREKGVSIGISYLKAVASLAAAKIEEAVQSGQGKINLRVRMAKHPSNINIKIAESSRKYITGRNKKIEVTGPVFIGVRAYIIV
jgi:O-phosphoseryl-tRNA synthetase